MAAAAVLLAGCFHSSVIPGPSAPAQPAHVNPTTYLVSLLYGSVTSPAEYVTSDPSKAPLVPLTSPSGGPLYTVAALRDPSILTYQNTYYMAYTAAQSFGVDVYNIGLASSQSMQAGTWKTITTPNWVAFAPGGDHGTVLNGTWFHDPVSNNYYLYFTVVANPLGTPANDYVVQFFPSTATFGTPQIQTLVNAAPNEYGNPVVAMWYNASNRNYFSLLQAGSTLGVGGAWISSSSSPTGTITILASPWPAPPNPVGGGTEFTGADGNLAVMFIDGSGGNLYYTECTSTGCANAPQSGTWTTPTVTMGGEVGWVNVVAANNL